MTPPFPKTPEEHAMLILALEHENDLLRNALGSALSPHIVRHAMRGESDCGECARLNRILNRTSPEEE